jgi:hypothetical protein
MRHTKSRRAIRRPRVPDRMTADSPVDLSNVVREAARNVKLGDISRYRIPAEANARSARSVHNNQADYSENFPRRRPWDSPRRRFRPRPRPFSDRELADDNGLLAPADGTSPVRWPDTGDSPRLAASGQLSLDTRNHNSDSADGWAEKTVHTPSAGTAGDPVAMAGLDPPYFSSKLKMGPRGVGSSLRSSLAGKRSSSRRGVLFRGEVGLPGHD